MKICGERKSGKWLARGTREKRYYGFTEGYLVDIGTASTLHCCRLGKHDSNSRYVFSS